jgi:hypothetical protein
MRTFFLALAAAALVAGAAARADDTPDKHPCFSVTDWHGWRASKTEQDVIYFRVRLHDIWRVQLTDKEPFLTAPDVHLVNKTVGPDMVCNPIDLQLKLAENHGIELPLIVKSLKKLTPDEIKALPKDDLP